MENVLSSNNGDLLDNKKAGGNGKEFKYNDLIYDSNNCLDYMRENGVDTKLLAVAERELQRDEFVKLLKVIN